MLYFSEHENRSNSSDDEDEGSQVSEIRFVPEDKNSCK